MGSTERFRMLIWGVILAAEDVKELTRELTHAPAVQCNVMGDQVDQFARCLFDHVPTNRELVLKVKRFM